MNTIFPSPNVSDSLCVESFGYKTDKMIYIERSLVRQYIREAKEKINKFNPDIVLIDTPPSITDVHVNLIGSLNISGLVMVTQPNLLILGLL
jgi:MinD-like ATPase involved in chromosome partitioning or flagellar assembly